jgi:hypothetical protein
LGCALSIEKYDNYELYEIFNDSNIVNYIKDKRLAWAGHLMRINDNRTLKRKYFILNWIVQEELEDRKCDGKMVLIKISEYLRLTIGRRSPYTETNGQSFLRRPEPTKGCRANDNDDDDDNKMSHAKFH